VVAIHRTSNARIFEKLILRIKECEMKTSNQDKRKEIADNFDVNNRKGVITFIILVIMLAILLTCGWYLGGLLYSALN